MIQDVMRNTDQVNNVVRRAKISTRHKVMLKQFGMEAHQVILPELYMSAAKVKRYTAFGVMP